MFPARVKELVGRLDPGSLTSFVEALISAEVARLDMDRNALVMSDDLTEADGGLDAIVSGVPAAAPDGSRAHLPAGSAGFQLKATKRKNPASFELAAELRKEGPKRVLSSDGAYVLVSGQDLNPGQRTALETALSEEASAVLAELGISGRGPRVLVWDAQTLAALSMVHPAPALDIGLLEFGQALSLTELLQTLRADERPFQTDGPRDDVIRRVHERAHNPGDPLLLMLHGDAGAGKTRTIAEALDTDDLRDLVLYINGSEGLQTLTTQLIRNPGSRGILFVDEVQDTDVLATSSRLGGLQGRWRLVSVLTRSDRAWLAQGGRNAVLPPLDAEATRRLVETFGLPESLARRVAEVAEGFPQLALRLADELRANPDLDLVSLANLPSSTELLKRALPDPTIRAHLAPMALFNAVGYEEELSYEVDAVAEVFGLDRDVLIRVCDAELPRGFISRAGRYRMVSPRLVAIWLASDLIASRPRFDELLPRLPESLQEAFVRQLEFFGPDSHHLPEALERIVAAERFRTPAAFTEAAARFLRASAAIVPEQVADAINALLSLATPEDLMRMPRRDLVWTLQVLLWWPATWRTAVTNLLRLAEHETETWSNNATGAFVGAFPVFLAGTLVPYQDRAEWLEGRIDDARPGRLRLLAAAAASGLQSHHVRTVVGFHGGGEPTDWRPESRAEYAEARSTAWRLLTKVRDVAPVTDQLEYTKQLAGALRSAYLDQGMGVVAAIAAGTWSVAERAELASASRKLLMFEAPGEPERDRILAVHDALVGADLAEKVEVLVRTPSWDLMTNKKDIHGVPPLLEQLADALAADPAGLELALSSGVALEDQGTRFALLRLVAERLGAAIVGERALGRADWVGVSAALSVADKLGEASWATVTLHRVALDDPERVPELLASADLTSERLDTALSLVEAGKAAPAGLGQLLFGGRIRALDEGDAVRLLRAIAAGNAVEPALGMLHQWVTDHGVPSAEVKQLASELALTALSGESAQRVDFDVQQLVEAGAMEGAVLVPLLEAYLTNPHAGGDGLAEILVSRVLEDRSSAAPALLELVRRLDVRGAMLSADLALLSRLAHATSSEEVWTELRLWPERDLRLALHHMSWGGDVPDPLVRAFLTSDRIGDLGDEAYVCFTNSLGVVMGPYHVALSKEVERARDWERDLKGTRGAEWAAKLVASELTNVEWHRRRDAEDEIVRG